MTQTLSPPNLASKLDGGEHWVNPLGGTVCVSCSPAASPDRERGRLEATDGHGGLVWRVLDEWSGLGAAEDAGGVLGRSAGHSQGSLSSPGNATTATHDAADIAGSCGDTTPSSPPTAITPTPTAQLYVSTRLDWFLWPIDGPRLAVDVELGNGLDRPNSSAPSAPAGHYRRVEPDCKWLGWLWRAIKFLPRDGSPVRSQAFAAMARILTLAVEYGAVCSGRLNADEWPRPAKGYEPPGVCEFESFA